jgi:hypothetical protein
MFVLSMYTFQYFNRRIIKYMFVIALATIAVDIIWFFLVAKHLWKPHLNEIVAVFLANYLKVSIFLIAIVLIFKICITFLLFS